MSARTALAIALLLLTGCAGHKAYSDATNAEERKSYVRCAVTRAFLADDDDSAPEDVAWTAMAQCHREREEVVVKLMEENAGKPFAARFVQAYMDELHTAMREHIALRLSEARQRRPDSTRT